VHAFPSPEHNQEAVLAAIHPSAGTLCLRVGYWRRRPLDYLAVFSTFARWTSSSRRTKMSGQDYTGICFPCKLRDFSSLWCGSDQKGYWKSAPH
jgi:hypothetical protein